MIFPFEEIMDLILYHAQCPDGWTAAYVAKQKYPGAELVPLKHGLSPEALDDLFKMCFHNDVLMLDYSLSTRELNDQMANVAKSFHIYDHHRTSQTVLEGADYATFDMTRSGAGLTWDYLFGTRRPWIVDFIEDRDLWNWKLPRSREICAYLNTLPFTLKAWGSLDWTLSIEESLKNIKYGKSFKGNMKRRFNGKGLSEEEKNKAKDAFLNFDGKCYCCGTTDAGKKGWVLDHKGDKFRGILCVWCNCAAGFLKDNIKKCKSLIQYLDKNNKVSSDYAAELGSGALAYIDHYTRAVVAERQEGVLSFAVGFDGENSSPIIRNYRTAVLNIPYAGVSEAGNALCKEGYEIGLAWFERGDGIIQFSLRSEGDIDVSGIAKFYGGGGHQHAAGFQLSIEKGRALVDKILGRTNVIQTPCWC
jgi:oligoribonuclease NrnB/cAMP/cGMP phosphodiesterase (DHH superfamily)